MNRYLMLTTCLFMFDVSSFAEFRVWHNTEGTPVKAEFKGMKDDKVILVREDGKEFLLLPDTLCEEDQAYIEKSLSSTAQSATEVSEKAAEVQFISKSEAKEVAEKYAAAIKDNNSEALKKLIWNSDDPDRAWNPENCLRRDISVSAKDITNVRIKYLEKRSYGYEIKMQVVTKDDGVVHECFVYAQMLRGGEIKYDTIGLPHPYEILCFLVEDEFTPDFGSWNQRDNQQKIMKFGIPDFDYESVDSDSDIKSVMKKMRDWLEDEGEEWDLTDPKVPCQEDVFDYWVKVLKSY